MLLLNHSGILLLITAAYMSQILLLLLHTLYIMDSQKVPGMVVLHSNGRIYSNTVQFTFKTGHLSTHTHTHTHTHTLAPSILPLLKHKPKAYFRIFRCSAVAFVLMSSMVAKRAPWGPFSEQGTAKSDYPESTVVGRWQELLSLSLVSPLPPNCMT
jgi:hypothetical protein